MDNYKVQVGDVVRINKDAVEHGDWVRKGMLMLVDEVTSTQSVYGTTYEPVRPGMKYGFSPRNYEVIARAVKPETGETLKEMAKRVCDGRNCTECPIAKTSTGCIGLRLASAVDDVEAQIERIREWAAANPPAPKPVNRVLTMCEVYALPEGAEVWGEEREGSYIPSMRYKRNGNRMDGERDGHYDLNDPDWPLFEGRVEVRFWSLPQPPTAAELAANPW